MSKTAPLILTDTAIDGLAQNLLDHAQTGGGRWIVGIAGIAGSGKSTLGERLVARIHGHPQVAADTAVLIPMDGFHLPNATLIQRGWKPRKGAAFTYDAPAYLQTLRGFAEPSKTGGFPVYCRRAHEPVPSKHAVIPSTRIIITEGQYLLLDEPPWNQLDDVLDEAWWLDVPAEQTRRWLMKRDTSVGRSAEEAQAKYQRNDRLNTEHVLGARRSASRVLRWPSQPGVNGSL